VRDAYEQLPVLRREGEHAGWVCFLRSGSQEHERLPGGEFRNGEHILHVS
jgi:hypothetical protein